MEVLEINENENIVNGMDIKYALPNFLPMPDGRFMDLSRKICFIIFVLTLLINS